MYTPNHFAEASDDIILELLRRTGFGHLVCMDDGELTSTPIPFLIDDSLRSARAHVAKANPMWRVAPCQALLIVPAADAYVSPGWYPSKAEHGKVVPTWNYEVVHLTGELVAYDDPAWIRQQVDDLTTQNEASMMTPWSISDAPEDFIASHSRAIVGLELRIGRIEAKRKLSQNRSTTDRAGVVDGLRARPDAEHTIATAMSDTSNHWIRTTAPPFCRLSTPPTTP